MKVGLHFALEKNFIFLFMFSTVLTLFTALLLFPLLVTIFVQFLILFHLTQMRFSPQSTHMLMCFSWRLYEDLFELGVSAAGTDFVSWSRLELIYISLIINQFQPNLAL